MAIFGLPIWFFVRAYQITQDYFFIAYLIVDYSVKYPLSYVIVIILRCCRVKEKKLFIVITPLECAAIFAKDFVFGFLAVKRNYVSLSTCWFVFGPVVIAYFIGFVLTIYIYMQFSKNSKNSTEYNMNDDPPLCGELLEKSEWTREAFRKTRRASWIIGFCTHLVFCLVVAPSVLWAKAFLTLVLIDFTITDNLCKIEEKIKAAENEIITSN
jgi:hypothetical protein